MIRWKFEKVEELKISSFKDFVNNSMDKERFIGTS